MSKNDKEKKAYDEGPELLFDVKFQTHGSIHKKVCYLI